MAAQPQFSIEERNFLALEYYKRKNALNRMTQVIIEFRNRFPDSRVPDRKTVRYIYHIYLETLTVAGEDQ